jgi:hypothetical protein
MTSIRRVRAALAAALVLLCVPAFGADATLTGDFYSAYIWRGITFAKGPVFQPTLDVSGVSIGKVPLSFTVWGNFNFDDWDGQVMKNEFSEVDFTVTAGLPKGFSVGYIEYVFTVGEPSTRELTAAWSHELPLATPTVTFYYDVQQIDSGFLELGLEREFALGTKAGATLKGVVGFAGDGFATYYGGEKGGFYQYDLSGALSYKLGEKGSIQGTFGFVDAFDHAILPKQDADFYGGVSLSYSF